MEGGTPDISVVIAVLDAAAILPRQLEALERQDFGGRWEVLVCDNGSRDDLATVVEAWRPRLPDLRLLDASDVGGDGFAKDVGIRAARADRVAICDADDVVAPQWLRAVHDALSTHGVVTGPLAQVPFDDVEREGADEVLARATFSTGPRTSGGAAYAPGCNCGYRLDAIPQGFAWDYVVGSDGATSWRAVARGASLGWAPEARVLFRERPGGARSFRREVSGGVARVRQQREFGGRVLLDQPLRLGRRYGWLLLRLPTVVFGAGRARWRHTLATTLGSTIETVAPGLWWGLQQRRRQRGAAADHVARLPVGAATTPAPGPPPAVGTAPPPGRGGGEPT